MYDRRRHVARRARTAEHCTPRRHAINTQRSTGGYSVRLKLGCTVRYSCYFIDYTPILWSVGVHNAQRTMPNAPTSQATNLQPAQQRTYATTEYSARDIILETHQPATRPTRTRSKPSANHQPKTKHANKRPTTNGNAPPPCLAKLAHTILQRPPQAPQAPRTGCRCRCRWRCRVPVRPGAFVHHLQPIPPNPWPNHTNQKTAKRRRRISWPRGIATCSSTSAARRPFYPHAPVTRSLVLSS